jgi:hypothetical protein
MGDKAGQAKPLSHTSKLVNQRVRIVKARTSGGQMTSLATALLLSCGVLAATVGIQQPPATTKVNADAQLLEDFRQRVDKYMELHRRLEKKSPPLKETDDPAKIKASQDALAAALAAERAGAKQGEIFTPAIAQLLRRLMYPEVTGKQGAETRKAIKEDAPVGVPLKVNARYPTDAPLPTVPPNVLASLPRLPEDLEYRIVGRHLLLRDVHANVIVDFIPNAIR